MSSARAAFTVLLIFLRSALTVPPPADVNVSCKNLDTRVTWSYDDLLPQTEFILEIYSSQSQKPEVKNTLECQYDLTPFVWSNSSEWNYLDFFYVTVTALQGGTQSRPAKSQTFTFNRFKMADIICKLDFPPVRVTADESGNTVIFRNPFIFYRELNELTKLETAFFKFKVSSDQGEYESVCALKETTCKYILPTTEGAQTCVKLRGWLYNGIGVEDVEFHQTAQVCSSGGAQVLAIALILTVIVIFILITLFCVLKLYKTKSIPKPSLAVLDMSQSFPRYLTVPREDVNDINVEPKQIHFKTPEDQSLYDDINVAEGDENSSSGQSSMKLYLYKGGEDLEDSDDEQPQQAGDLASSEHGSEEEEEEDEPEERSPYDRPHVQM